MSQYRCIEVGNSTENKNMFLSFPDTIYEKGFSSQNKGDEEQLLQGEHPLSRRFVFSPFLLQDGRRVIGRAALSFYPEKPDTCFLGFFEMEENAGAALFFLDYLEGQAKKQGCKRMVGPMNASFWLGYRMRTNAFETKPFFSEPYNPSYYPELWKNSGYVVTDEYISNFYPPVLKGGYQNKRYQKRLELFSEKGYTFENPSPKNWDRDIREIYALLVELYAGFPGYSFISEEEFIGCYNGLRHILDFSFCYIARYQGKAVAFTITIPDYGTLLNGSLSLPVALKMLYRKKTCRQYLLAYMGVQPEHKGLGTAMVQLSIEQLRAKKAGMVGAFIHKGKVTGGYAGEYISRQHTYALLEKELG